MECSAASDYFQNATVEEKKCASFLNLSRKDINESDKENENRAKKVLEYNTLLRNASIAYTSKKYLMASCYYKTAYCLSSTIQDTHINNIRMRYMLCISGLESENLEDLTVIVQHLISLEKNIQESNVHFPAVYYALGKAHCKLYRFLLAYDAVNKGFAFLNNNVQINEYCIPTTNIVIPETTREGLLVALVQLKEECSTWHRPDAVCCMDECLDHSQHYAPSRYIFFSDPAFNGMVILTCNNVTHPCVVKFHQSCWKYKKEQLSSIKKLSDKDIIGYKCFTPNCETSEGLPSVVIRVEVVGEGGNIKTRFDAPTNTHSWPKRNPAAPKGAIKKQNKVKPQTAKPRKLVNPSNCMVPVQNSPVKEPPFNEEAEMKWRLKKLAYLRNRNFGVPEDTDWRPNKEWYGNSFMKVIAEVLPNPDFTKDDARTSSLKSFVFSLIYAYIEENGPVKRAEVLRMWNDTKLLIENYNSVLNDSEDIFDFLLQSLKIVAIGEYLCIPKILPQLYNIVKEETSVYLRFFVDNTTSDKAQDQPDEYEKSMDGGTLDEVDIYEDAYDEDMDEEEVEEDILDESMISNYNSGTTDKEVSPAYEEDGFLPTDFLSLDNNITSDQIEASASSDVKSKDAVSSSEIKEPGVMTVNEDTETRHRADVEKDPSVDADDLQESRSIKENLVEESQLKEVIAATNDNDFVESSDILDDSVQKEEIKEEAELKKEVEAASGINHCEGNEDYPESTVEKCTDFNEFTWNELFAVYTNEIDDTNAADNKKEKSTVKINNINPYKECENADLVSEVSESKDLASDSTMHQMEQRKRSTKESRRLKRKYRTIVKRKGMSVPRLRWIRRKRVTMMDSRKTMKNEIKRLKKVNAKLVERREKEQQKLHKEIEECKRVLQQKISEFKMTKDHEIHKRRSFLKKCLDSQYNSNMTVLVAAVNQFRESLAIVGGMQDLLEKITAKRVFANGVEVEWQQLIAHIQSQSSVLANEFLKLKADLESNENLEKLDAFSLQLQNVPASPFPNLSKIVETGFTTLIMHYNRVIQHIQMTRPVPLMSMPVQRPPIIQQPYMGYPLQYPAQMAMPQNSVIIRNPGLSPCIQTHPVHLNACRTEGNAVVQNVQQATPENGQHHNSRDDAVIKREETPKELQSAGQRSQENNPESQEQIDLAKENFESLSRESGAKELPSESTLDLPTEIHSLFSSSSPAELISKGTKKRKSRKPKKTVFIDDLLQRLRKKYVGVLESDLLDSILDVRRQHKSLTGMKVSVIIEKAAPFIEKRQVAQLCDYTRPIKTESAEVFASPSNKNKKRRQIVIPTSTTTQDSQLSVRRAVEQGGTIKKNPWEIINDQRNKWQKDSQEVECNICIEPMVANAKPIYTLSCQHAFHKSCIKSWFRHSQSCPTCRIHCTIDDEFPPLP